MTFESVDDTVDVDRSRSLTELTLLGVPFGDSFKPKITTLNFRSELTFMCVGKEGMLL